MDLSQSMEILNITKNELYSLNNGLIRKQDSDFSYFSKIKQKNDDKLIYVDEQKVFNNSSRF